MLKQNLFYRLFATALLLFGVLGWGQTTVSYVVTTTSSVTTTGTAPTGSNATYAQTFNTAKQITKNNNAVLTLSGYAGKKITSLVLEMKSNANDGAGTLEVKAGTTVISSINPTANFNSTNWYGAYSNGYVNITKTPTAYTVGNGENIVITIAATTSSLYIQKYTLTYEDGTPSCTPPTTQSTTFSSSNISTSSAQINWVRGNGDNVLVWLEKDLPLMLLL